jgi:hypothetical protein
MNQQKKKKTLKTHTNTYTHTHTIYKQTKEMNFVFKLIIKQNSQTTTTKT